MTVCRRARDASGLWLAAPSRRRTLISPLHPTHHTNKPTRAHDMSGRGRGRGRGGFSKGNTRFTGKKGGNFRSGGPSGAGQGKAPERADDGTAQMERFEEVKVYDAIDEALGFPRFESGRVGGEAREGWLVNMHSVRLRPHQTRDPR